MLITFEGIDGVGKSTQAKLLYDSISEAYGLDSVVITRDPGGGEVAELIRHELLCSSAACRSGDVMLQLFLFMAARRDNCLSTIFPALSVNKIVICDRFMDSSMAYQGHGFSFAKEGLEFIKLSNRLVTNGIEPDITFVLISNDVAKSLSRTSEKNTFECTYDLDYYARVERGFLEIAKSEPKRCVILNVDFFCIEELGVFVRDFVYSSTAFQRLLANR